MSQYKYTLAALLVWGILAYLYANNKKSANAGPKKDLGEEPSAPVVVEKVVSTKVEEEPPVAVATPSDEAESVAPAAASSEDDFVYVDVPSDAIESVSTMAKESNGELLSFVDAKAEQENHDVSEETAAMSTQKDEMIRAEASTKRKTLEDADNLLGAASFYTAEYQEFMKKTAEELTQETYVMVEKAKPMVGLRLAEHSHGLLVKGYYVGGPADQVGIRIDDKILSIEQSEPKTLAEMMEAITLHCVPTKLTNMTLQKDSGRGEVYEVKLWIMTSDETFVGKPYYYDMSTAELIEKQSSSAHLSPGSGSKRKGGKKK